MASTMASHMLAVCPTPFERTHLLRLLAEDSFGDGYKCNGEEGRGKERLARGRKKDTGKKRLSEYQLQFRKKLF